MERDARRATVEKGYASLCFLSFNRPQLLLPAIRSAVEAAGYPCEVIVHDDGSDWVTQEALVGLVRTGKISSLVLNPSGHNEGVGRSLNRALALASGDYVVKLDQDLIFFDGWLRKSIETLEADLTIGMLGLFKYEHDPVDWRKMQIEWDADSTFGGLLPPVNPPVPYHYVKDFVGSAMVVPRDVLAQLGRFPEHSDAFAEDVEYKTRLKAWGYELALPDDDLAHNRGFGYGPSTVNIAPGKVQTIHAGPVIYR